MVVVVVVVVGVVVDVVAAAASAKSILPLISVWSALRVRRRLVEAMLTTHSEATVDTTHAFESACRSLSWSGTINTAATISER